MMTLTPLLRRLAAAASAALALGSCDAAEWKRLDSPHFVTYARVREDKAREFVMQLELTRWLTMKLLGTSEPAAPGPTVVPQVLLTDEPPNGIDVIIQSAYSYSSDVECLRVSGVAATAGITPGDRRTGAMEIQAAQQIYATRLMLLHAPMSFPQRWYAQGFAQYLATTTYREGLLIFGAPHVDAMDKLADTNAWLPYEKLLRLGRNAVSPVTDTPMFDAQSWLLVYALLETPDGKRQLADYLEAVARGEPSASAFETATGRGLAAWTGELKARVREHKFNARVVRKDLLPAVQIRVSPVDPDWSGYVELRHALNCGTRDKQVGQALRAALKQWLGNSESLAPELRLTLARADWLAGDAVAATAKLDALTRTTPQMSEARLLFGRLLREQADAAAGEERSAAYQRANEQLREAQRLSPQQRGVADELAHVLHGLGRESEALVAVREARRVDPTRWETIRLEAELALRTGDRQGAIQALETLAFQSIWPAIAARSNDAIAAIETHQPVDAVVRLLGLPLSQ